MSETVKLEINKSLFSEKELKVCKLLHFAITNKNCVCDPTKFSEEEDRILEDFEKRGYMRIDANSIIIKKEFKNFLDSLIEEEPTLNDYELLVKVGGKLVGFGRRS